MCAKANPSEKQSLAVAVWTLAGFLVIGFCALRQATDPAWQDTEGFLSHSLYLAEHGGIVGFLRDCFAGQFPMVERHPLYMLMLSPLASRQLAFFFQAKLVNLFFGAVTLASLLWMTAKKTDAGAALAAGALYAVSNSLITHSSHVNCDMLLTLCGLWAWWFLIREKSSWNWLWAGCWAGLAFLAKTSGTLLVAATLVAWVATRTLRLSLTKNRFSLPAAFILGFVLTASPLLVRNVRAHGRLLYEGFNSHAMWFDRWEELGNPTANLHEDRYAIHTVENEGTLPTLHSYLVSHSPEQIAARLIRGAYRVSKLSVDAVAPSLPLPRWARILWFTGVLAFAGYGWWSMRSTWMAILSASWVAVLAVFLIWYAQVVPDIRFLAPGVPLLFVFSGLGAWLWSTKLLGKKAFGCLAIKCAVIVGVCALMPLIKGDLSKPQPLVSASPAYLRLIDWMNANLKGGGRFVTGPTDEFYGLKWLVTAPVETAQMPLVNTEQEFLHYLDAHRVTYWLATAQSIRGIDNRLLTTLANHWQVGKGGSIKEKSPLQGWRQVASDAQQPPHYLVYARQGK